MNEIFAVTMGDQLEQDSIEHPTLCLAHSGLFTNHSASGRREAEQSSGVDLEVYLKFGGAMCATGIILGFGMFLLTRDD